MNDWRWKWRFYASAFLLGLVLTGLSVRLVFLHALTPESVVRGIDESRRMHKQLLAGRGAICDRMGSGNLLALNVPMKDVCANPALIVRSNLLVDVSATLSELLDVPVDEVAQRLNRPDREFAYIRRAVMEDDAARVLERRIPGVFFRENMVRHYPHRNFMCHILGFVNHDGIGSAGIEQAADAYLRGSPGYLESQVDALRREMYGRRAQYVAPLEGAHVVLTVDQQIQYQAERALDAAMIEHRAKGACVIVQRIRTGEILAMASRPAFDLNTFNQASESERTNRAIGMNYEPGSTFKGVAFSAAFNEQTVRPEMVVDCEDGAWSYGGKVLRDYHAYDRLTVADGLKKSSNILTAKTALTLGNQRFYRYLKAFHIGEPLGFDLPGEEGGILAPVSKWSKISSTRIAMGQGVAVTPLQMLAVYCAIANDGFLMRPYIISHVVSPDGTVLKRTQPEVLGRPIRSETAALMCRLLARVTEPGGTGTRACVEGYEVAGKTGSAQKPVAGGYSSTAHVASFAGFVPAGAPEIGIIVVIDEPQPLHTGGVVAAPLFSRIAGYAVRYLDVAPGRNLLASR
ncbi:MAG: hypothetical protein A2498_07285 [Lentisphaerae bacterium RIFOXYC12_FULL_60_16]|nr:MAG: hypothetical protein A2498_07285 [Lentisphaerae bacterium RIFOXYC12_FULL_60_16]OGV86471.1 MAG: hypothetical protein A2340_08990 [Lentisphaerae bacterium RIFOXYB12_FULL_60_10]